MSKKSKAHAVNEQDEPIETGIDYSHQLYMKKLEKLSLDVDAPDKVADILRQAAEAYYEASTECEANWQDESAGRPWRNIARILEKAAGQIEKYTRN